MVPSYFFVVFAHSGRQTGWLAGYTVPIGEKTTMQEKQLHEKNVGFKTENNSY